jgi:hypothetical protein
MKALLQLVGAPTQNDFRIENRLLAAEFTNVAVLEAMSQIESNKA